MKRSQLPRFFHLRNYVKGRLMERGGETFYVMPLEKSRKYLPGNDEYHADVEVAHARCNTLDNFCRRIGREITVNRMRKGQQTYFMTWEEFLQGLEYNRQQRRNMKARAYRKARV